MKNEKRGFVAPTLLAIIVILIIGAGLYIYQNKKTETTKQNPPSTTSEPASYRGSNVQNMGGGGLCPQGQKWGGSGCVPTQASEPTSLAQTWVSLGKTYKDPFGFSLSYPPDTWIVTKQVDGSVLVQTNSPDTNTITIKEVSGSRVTDSNGKFGSVSYYYGGASQWMRIGTHERDGSPTTAMPVAQYPTTLSGLPIFSGAILSHGFGQYVYIVALSPTKFLVITGGEPSDLSQDADSLLMALVRTISLGE